MRTYVCERPYAVLTTGKGVAHLDIFLSILRNTVEDIIPYSVYFHFDLYLHVCEKSLILYVLPDVFVNTKNFFH